MGEKETCTVPFFIVGSQRSGTTLLRLILNAHGDIAIPEEGTFWMPLIRANHGRFDKAISAKLLRKYIEYIRVNDQFRTWNMDAEAIFDGILGNGRTTLKELMESLYEGYASRQNKRIWGDKTPSFFRKIGELSYIFPEARFIHVIRDGRDVYLSMRKMESGRDNVAVAALEWRYKIEKTRQLLRQLPPDRYFELQYEQLIKTPERQLSELCAFLSIDYDEQMLNFWRTSEQFVGRHHSELIFQPIIASSAEKWKKTLTLRENMVFELIALDILKQLGYNIMNGRACGLFSRVKVLGLLCAGLPRRGFQILFTAMTLHLSSILGRRTSAAGGKKLS